MKLAKVIGTVVCTVKDPSLKGVKLMMIQPLDENQKPVGAPLAAADAAQAGVGDLVWWTLSREASLALPNTFSPVDAAITAIVDEINPEDVGISNKDEIFSKEER